jgi:DNA-binding CsgD family transcriptional regulator
VNIKNLFPTLVLFSAALFFAYDILADFMAKDEALLHIIIELFVFLAITVVLFGEIRRLKQVKVELSEEKSRTARLSGELLAVMRNQFVQWGLSRSESDIALLLIKGLSMQEIADLRQVKEKTVRQQATSVYAKSGYAGRHELVAHFIEDLMRDNSLGT